MQHVLEKFHHMHYDAINVDTSYFLHQVAYFPFYLIKQKICILGYVTCHFFGPKIVFFWVIFLRDQYALLFSLLLHNLILLFLRFEFAQDSKNFQKMDIVDVRNRDRRNTFGKFDALLGVLRNFFGSIIGRPYMQ